MKATFCYSLSSPAQVISDHVITHLLDPPHGKLERHELIEDDSGFYHFNYSCMYSSVSCLCGSEYYSGLIIAKKTDLGIAQTFTYISGIISKMRRIHIEVSLFPTLKRKLHLSTTECI